MPEWLRNEGKVCAVCFVSVVTDNTYTAVGKMFLVFVGGEGECGGGGGGADSTITFAKNSAY